ncbi:hypothetical protein LTR36_003390 [Oleoguttula mirabilis]|uniref:3-beta hydroxysteroid dehydrogenase/isomerase domain-containing protein n=1 Tax=Oleoguttula mirabilis TaxID=1507867 RepID=A0AAV9JJ04_9PEZI|nr:hypothetical protein LTR36_003390 [Oleoguttula mirabilis]
MPLPSDAVLPHSSLVLVTGANGFVACQIVNQLLDCGLRVRGTVRDLQKSAWMQEHFDNAYGPGKFELVKVDNMVEEGSLDEAVKGCAGVLHVASNLSFHPDPNIVVTEAIALVKSVLESATKEPSVKRFVYTSSSSAACQMKWNEAFDLTSESWNTTSIAEAWKPPPYEQDRALHVYNASKAQAEQFFWRYVEDHKPHFVGNAVLPDFVCGAPVSLEKQGYGPTGGILYCLWTKNDMWKMLPTQYMIDAKDCALLHIGALTHPDYQNERIFGYAHPKRWTDWIARLKKMYPTHEFPDSPENEDYDMSKVLGQHRAEALLKWLGQPGWRPMDESIKEVFDLMV